MFTEGLAFGFKNDVMRGFDTYCRLEGIDRQYLVSNLRGKKRQPQHKSRSSKVNVRWGLNN